MPGQLKRSIVLEQAMNFFECRRDTRNILLAVRGDEKLEISVLFYKLRLIKVFPVQNSLNEAPIFHYGSEVSYSMKIASASDFFLPHQCVVRRTKSKIVVTLDHFCPFTWRILNDDIRRKTKLGDLPLTFLVCRFGAIILAFFFSSSQLTKLKSDEKKLIEEEHKEGGQRDWSQVLANSAVGTILSVWVAYATGFQDSCFDTREAPLVTGLLGGILGHYACCNGDTWSSEIGVLSNSSPRLITTFRQVPRGTNGGVSLLGLFAAAGGGAFIGLVFFIVGHFTADCTGRTSSSQWLLLPIGTAVGLLGSLFDSVLGATVQFSGNCAVRKKVVGKPGPTVKKISGYDILTNTGVNFVSALLMSLATAAACLCIF